MELGNIPYYDFCSSHSYRRKCAAKLFAIRKVDARIPRIYYSVELSFEKATNCTRLLIDNLVIKFHFKQDKPDKILVETWKKSIEQPKRGTMEACVKHYLMKPNAEIRNLTISVSDRSSYLL